MRIFVTKTVSFLIAILLALAIATPAFAAEITTNGLLPAGQTIDDDLLVSAQIVQIDGTIKGNLIASGQTVSITGTIQGDAIISAANIFVAEDAKIEGNLISAASTIEIAGDVDGSVIGASAAMHLLSGANIRRNAITAGYSFTSDSDSQIGLDLYTADYQAILHGSVGRDAVIAAGAIEVYAGIGRDGKFDLGDTSNSDGGDPQEVFKNIPFFQQQGIPAAVAPGLRIDKGASIGGKIEYTGTIDQSDSIQAKPGGGVIFSTPTPSQQPTEQPERKISNNSWAGKVLSWLWKTLQNLVTLLILAVLAAWKLPNQMVKVASTLVQKPAESLGYGFIVVIIGYVGAFFMAGAIFLVCLLISLVSLGGLSNTAFGLGFSSFALVFCVFQFLVSYGSKLVVAWLLGTFLIKAVSPQTGHNMWALALFGVIAYVIPVSIPFIGWLFSFIATLAGMGALWLLFLEWRNKKMLTTG